MKLLKTFKDQEPEDGAQIKTREAARAVLFDENGLVPLLFVRKSNFHKLPGGGVEPSETIQQALAREIMEETGCRAEITEEVGSIKEYRSRYNLDQTSYCFLGKVLSKGQPQFTNDEMDEGFELTWLTIDQAIAQLKDDEPENYEGIFIQKRDLTFLEAAQQILQPKRGTLRLSSGQALDVVRVTNAGPWTKGSSEGQRRMDIRPGTKVAIVLKKDQRTGKLTEGIVQDLLTSKANHPRGIKVRLTDGQVGRVQFIR